MSEGWLIKEQVNYISMLSGYKVVPLGHLRASFSTFIRHSAFLVFWNINSALLG